MKFTVYKTSDRLGEDAYQIEINSLEELIKFQQDCDEDIILLKRDNEIEIYDDYRE